MRFLQGIGLLAVIGVALAGCGSDATNNATCGQAGRSGTTPCLGGVTCNAGQYCNNGFCDPGCTSDTNCSAQEYCLRATGASLGACTRCATMTASVDMSTSTTTVIDMAGTTTTTASCCLNNAYYSCPTKDAFVKCTGFDYDGCIALCAAADFNCQMNCVIMASMATTHDPSSCTRNSSLDGTCGTTTTFSCNNASFNVCSIDSDCNNSSQHCTGGKCYTNSAGSKCDIDADCGLNTHCTSACCYPNVKNAPCDITADCGSGSSCVSGKCN